MGCMLPTQHCMEDAVIRCAINTHVLMDGCWKSTPDLDKLLLAGESSRCLIPRVVDLIGHSFDLYTPAPRQKLAPYFLYDINDLPRCLLYPRSLIYVWVVSRLN